MSTTNLQNRTIFCHDNLEILQGINSNSIDLIYLDPPFNKNKVFTAPIGSSAEGASFKDWFREEDVKDEWVQTIKEDNIELHNFLIGIKTISTNKYYLYNYCYLSYMAIRLIEMRRVLKDTGSIYLHCDPTMSHYIKLLMDIIFGEKNFRNEITWYYKKWTNTANFFQRNHDIIFFYVKTTHPIFNKEYGEPTKRQIELRKLGYNEGTTSKGQKILRVYDKNKAVKKIEKALKEGREIYYIKDKTIGEPIQDVWNFSVINSQSKEKTGYPTQKPLKLLERIIKASSNEGDIVLDPFCGCATTCVASDKLNRQWIGIDVSVLAYDLVRERLQKEVADPEKLTEYQNKIHYFTNPPKRTDLNGDDNIIKKNVYIISHPNFTKADLYKVGIANDLNSRLNSYQTSDPLREYKIEFYKKTQFYRETENYIHKKFSFSHEWVNGRLEDIIKAIEEFDINKYNQTERILF